MKNYKEKNKVVNLNSRLSIERYNYYYNKYGWKYKIISVPPDDFGSRQSSLKERFKKISPKTKLKKTSLQKNNINKSSIDKVIESIFNEITNFYFFAKHRKGTKAYELSFELIKKHYKKYRYNIIDIFKLANNYFSNPRFILKQHGKMAVYEFFKYDNFTIERSKLLQKINVKSWFNEFAKGINHIEKNFVTRQKDKFPEVTRRFENIWMNYKKITKIEPHEHDNLVVFMSKCYKMRDLNKNKITSAFDIATIINEIIFQNKKYNIENTNYLISNYFWKNTVPYALREWGLFKEHEQINLI